MVILVTLSDRPSRRGQAHAKNMLKEALLIARQKGIREVLLTCDEANLASRAVILANNGVYQDTRGNCQRYWIKE